MRRLILILCAFAWGVGTASAQVVYDFNAGAAGWTAAGNAANPWAYSPSGGASGTGGWVVNQNVGYVQSTLTSPTLFAAGGPVTWTFTHRFNFRFDYDTGLPFAVDGGDLRISVNGGPFTGVGAGALTGVGYDTSTYGNIAILDYDPHFMYQSAGYAGGSHVSTTVDLGTFAANDTIVLQFRGGWDVDQSPFITIPADPSWAVDNVTLTGLTAIPEPSSLLLAAACAPLLALARRPRSPRRSRPISPAPSSRD